MCSEGGRTMPAAMPAMRSLMACASGVSPMLACIRPCTPFGVGF